MFACQLSIPAELALLRPASFHKLRSRRGTDITENMLALGYIILLFALGDAVLRRFFSFESIHHRLAAAFLAGLLICTWATYILALLFASADQPLLPANIAFLVVAGGVIIWLKRVSLSGQPGDGALSRLYGRFKGLINRQNIAGSTSKEFQESEIPVIWNSKARPAGNSLFDLLAFGVYTFIVSFLMLVTMGSHDNKIRIAAHHWTDFGPNSGIMQNFVFGHNFPPENTHFAGELIRYHFLFWFQAANLQFLGLDPATAINVLSILSMVAALILISVLAELLFRSRAVGRLAALLFFASGSLAYTKLFGEHDSLSGVLSAITKLVRFISSGYPWRGEDWGIWTVDVFLQQRHFISAIGILLIAVIFSVRHFQNYSHNAVYRSEKNDLLPERVRGSRLRTAAGFAICGLLIGLLPLWNGAVFVSAFLIFLFLFLFFRGRSYLVIFAAVTAVVSLPQIYFMSSGTGSVPGYPTFRLGYVIVDPTIMSVVSFLAFSIGFKWVLIAIGLAAGKWFHVRLFIAVATVLVLVFLVQFSPELVANHKFINVWLVFANLFAAYGFWSLWKAEIFKPVIASRLLGIILLAGAVTGGLIDLFPVWNESSSDIAYKDTRLIDWIKQETPPGSVFLSKHYVVHDITLAGRKLYYGHQLFAWSAGLDTVERDNLYAKMFSEREPEPLVNLLNTHGIDYVAIDNQLRDDKTVKNLNEAVYQRYFEKVFEDTERKFGNIVIFKVPQSAAELPPGRPPLPPEPISETASSDVSVFKGGTGTEVGQFKSPRGIATDKHGNIYVADTGNARIQKFGPTGRIVAIIGSSGSGEGQMKEPNGIAIDTLGNIYVTDAVNHKVMKYRPDGVFSQEWRTIAGGFYGPRDIEFGPNNMLYIVDQGRTRVVRFDPSTESFDAWGSSGPDEGQFNDPTGIAVGNNSVYVADVGNFRIQKFDLNGKFLQQWRIDAWEGSTSHFPDMIYDELSDRLYISSGKTNEILSLGSDGTFAVAFGAGGPAVLGGPSALAMSGSGNKKRLLVLNNVNGNVASIDLGQQKR